MSTLKYLSKHGLSTLFKRGVRFTFHGTQAEWDALSDAEKSKYDQAEIWDTMSDAYYSTPVGVIQAYMGTTAPDGWLLCDGATFDTDAYPKLYAVLGKNTVPDLREVTLKGIGTNAQGAAHNAVTLGAFQDDRNKAHSHTMAHTHSMAHTHNVSGNTGYMSGNATGELDTDAYGVGRIVSNARGNISLRDAATAYGVSGNGTTITRYNASINVEHYHSFNVTSGGSSAANTGGSSAANTGSDGGVTTEVKAVGVNYIICAK